MDTLGGRGTGWQARLAVTASILPAGSAIGDEVHQVFEPSRTGSMMYAGWDALRTALALAARPVIWRS